MAGGWREERFARPLLTCPVPCALWGSVSRGAGASQACGRDASIAAAQAACSPAGPPSSRPTQPGDAAASPQPSGVGTGHQPKQERPRGGPW